MKYNENKISSFYDLSQDVLKFWQDNQIFEKSISNREGAPTFTFFEGPPSANGSPGIHHVMARTIKDIFCRYKTLKGFQVKRKGGWDTHGLPVELQVEKELGITKEDIGTKITVEEYNQKCRESVMKFKSEWDDLTQKMGYWVDLDDPYITFENDYIESLWNLLQRLFDKDLLYKGYTIQPYSPAAGTGLSSHELNLPGCYRDVKDTSITAQFKVKGKEDEFFLAWTTTPWTLPSNAALAVGKNIEYVKVETFNPYTFKKVFVILAKDLMGKYFNDKAKDIAIADYKEGDKLIPFQVVESFKGSELTGTEYEQLLPYVQPEKPAFKVIIGDFVSTEDGTGIVHIAPTFGADDQRVANQAGIPPIIIKDEDGNELPLVDKTGKFVKEVTDFPEMYVKDAYYTEELPKDHKSVDVQIAIKLKEENKAFKVEKYEHSYPHCWRTDKPVLYYPLESWFIKTTAIKDKMIDLNNTINWKPAATGTGRFGNWLENLVDWNLSRSRFWGTPLPIWMSEDKKEMKCIGSVAELNAEMAKANEKLGVNNPAELPDLHRPYVDDVILVSDSGQKMIRESDLIDVWFDSGAMPYAQWHYPFENDDIFKNSYPADFISEGVDQTRGWFFTLHAIAALLFDSVAFKNVVSTGLVLDKNGNKMSKRLGNAVNPFETLKKYGPDATRWYMITNAQPWDNLKFDLDGITEVSRRFFGTLQNTYSFFALYANLDGFQYEGGEIDLVKRTEADRWILSKLNSLIKEVDDAYGDYEPTKAGRAIQNFVIDDLSNWYVRLNRKRFWKGEYNEDKKAAYQTLYKCLEVISKLIAPISPFYSEQLFKDLNAVTGRETVESVHLADYPAVNEAEIDADLEHKMTLAQQISSMVHSIRKAHTLKVRQPLQKILVPVLDADVKVKIEAIEELIKGEVNIKEVEYIDDTSGILVKSIKPNFASLGKKFGPKMKFISQAVGQMGQDEIKQIESTNAYEIDADGEKITLTQDDVLITSKDIPGWAVANDNGLTVALDLTVSDELKKEGIARDIVNRVQNIRKDSGLDVMDKINILAEKHSDNLLESAILANQDYICTETQALKIELLDTVPDATAVEMDDFELKLKVEKA